MAKSLLERFNEKYIPEPNTGCWLWTAYLRPDGYGEIQRGSRGAGKILAHRASYEMLVGQIPEDLELDHKCRTRCCVNPGHLEPVTRLVNILRGAGPASQKSRFAAMTHCRRGHEFTPENTYVNYSAKGYINRMCRRCTAARVAEYRTNKKRAFQCSAS